MICAVPGLWATRGARCCMTNNGTRDLLTAMRLRAELQFQPELDAAFLELETPRQRVVDASRSG